MKATHILLLFVLAASVGIIIAMSGDFTTYVNFDEAKAKSGKAVNVAGFLAKDKDMIYDPMKDPNYFVFTMYDRDGGEQKVLYKGTKPTDFERSEQVVVKGKMDGEYFAASEILMKCPSKYVDDKIELKEVKAQASS